MDEYPCRSCGKTFSSYQDLALHISVTKKGHRAGKKWAASYLTKVNILNQKRDLPERSVMTEEQKEAVREAKIEAHRTLSGEVRLVKTFCPKCSTRNYQSIPVEYVNSTQAWRASDGALMILCDSCRR